MTFNRWLRQQRDRDDPIGDLSRDYIDDCRRNKIGKRDVKDLRREIMRIGGFPALSALASALNQYRLSRHLKPKQ
jgi:hypothetical protein